MARVRYVSRFASHKYNDSVSFGLEIAMELVVYTIGIKCI